MECRLAVHQICNTAAIPIAISDEGGERILVLRGKDGYAYRFWVFRANPGGLSNRYFCRLFPAPMECHEVSSLTYNKRTIPPGISV
jgi:hypothetical protein